MSFGYNKSEDEVTKMPRTYKSKNIQTKPELAGAQNIPEEFLAKRTEKDEDKIATLTSLACLFKVSQEMSHERKTKGTNWTPEEMEDALVNYFDFVVDKCLKPSRVSLALYLGTHKQQIWDWENHPERYGAISELIKRACGVIEQQYVERSEQYPTANLFLLKTSHGHVEKSQIEITGGNPVSSADEIAEQVKKMGLDA